MAIPLLIPSVVPPFVGDSDGDGLADTTEMMIGTNLNNPNSDGARYSDGEEYNDNTPEYVKEPGKSPLFPAYPDLKIELSSSYHIWLKQDISTATETVESNDYEYGIETLETTTTDFSNQLTVEVGYSLADLGVSVRNQFDWANSHTLVTRTNQRFLMASAKTWSEMLSTDIGNSYLYITMRIKNIGSDILESEPADIWLSLYVGADYDPIKTWSFASSYRGARISPLRPGETRTINVEFHDCLSLDLLERIECGEPVRIEIQNYDLGEDRVYLQNMKDNLIQLDIDNGSKVTTSYIGVDSIKLTDFLTEYADMLMNGNAIQSIASLENSEKTFWEIIIPTVDEVPNNILDAMISQGDHVVLLYQKHSDDDGILDRDELVMGLNPNSDDSDNDNISDDREVYGTLGTNPLNPDTDFDRLDDEEEIESGMDGYITSPTKADSDNDGLDDYEEFLNSTNPNNDDTDGDGLSDGEEVNIQRTDPKNPDTDGDNLSDGEEVNVFLTDPKDFDTDEDGLNDGDEIDIGSNPFEQDTDVDGFIDGEDVDPLSDIILNVNLTRMVAYNTADELFTNLLDVYFMVYIFDSDENPLNNSRYDCPDNTNSYMMSQTVSFNVPDNEIYIFIKIEGWDRDFLPDDQLDVSSSIEIYLYFSYNLKTDTWYEVYGGDPELDGITSGLDDGEIVGGQVKLWYWLYTS